MGGGRGSLLANNSLLTVLNFVLSWLSRSSTTAASSDELSEVFIDWGGLEDAFKKKGRRD